MPGECDNNRCDNPSPQELLTGLEVWVKLVAPNLAQSLAHCAEVTRQISLHDEGPIVAGIG